jgi:hypothetical protein
MKKSRLKKEIKKTAITNSSLPKNVIPIDKEFKNHVSLSSIKGFSGANDGGDISSPNVHKDIVKPVESILKDFKGIKITSASRTKKFNDSLKGAVKNSDHTYGKALDLRINSQSKAFLAKVNSDPKYMKSLGIRTAFKHGDHIHVSWDKA